MHRNHIDIHQLKWLQNLNQICIGMVFLAFDFDPYVLRWLILTSNNIKYISKLQYVNILKCNDRKKSTRRQNLIFRPKFRYVLLNFLGSTSCLLWIWVDTFLSTSRYVFESVCLRVGLSTSWPLTLWIYGVLHSFTLRFRSQVIHHISKSDFDKK